VKRILKSWKHPYLARVGIFLIALALIVGTVSCDGGGGGGGGAKYSLTMVVNPGVGGTATDLNNTSPYAAGTTVSIQAVANATAGYQFVSWTAVPAGGFFTNATAANTTFTMPAQNVTVTANFAVGGATYSLNMTVNPGGGGTATDLTNTSPYAANTVVNIQAVAASGYKFVNWTSSDGGTFGNTTAAATTFTMPSQNVTVTANFVRVYNLTMAVSPPGAGTTTPIGTTTYPASTVVNITASANLGYVFVNWTASPAVAFGNATAATTTFTMPAQNVTVTAFFASVPTGQIDHFKWYFANGTERIDEVVYLEDQFCTINATVGSAVGFANPVIKWHGNVTPISNPDHHLTAYGLDYEGEPQTYQVEVKNQFGTQNLTVYGPIGLLVPTQKEGHQPPVGLDHYLLYVVNEGNYVGEVVSLQDQFDSGPQESMVYDPVYFANPVRKTHGNNVTEIVNPDVHLVVYMIDASFSGEVDVVNQFGQQTLEVYTFFGFGGLAVPSEKIEWHQVQEYNHGLAYYAWNGSQYIGEDVTLEDRFGAVNATVTYPYGFSNPVEKWHDGVLSPIWYPDYHYLINNITCEGEPGEWLVVVENQFGIQELTVSGPTTLSTPAQKLEPYYHDAPVGADHLLGYKAIAGEAVNQIVDLSDEFGDFTDVLVTCPTGLGNPARKIHDGNVTEIPNVGDVCWVTYNLSLQYSPFHVKTVDQFGEQTLDLWGPLVLSVPSRILSYERIPEEPDHYLVYYAWNGTQYIGEDVTLEDRFGAVNATVTYSFCFGNPAEKWHDGVLSPIRYPDIHNFGYNITCEGEPGEWLVVVENQFGIQELTVSGPNMLNAPAQKLEPYYHDPPVGAFHSLSYHCIAGEAVNQIVDLSDEFDDFTGVLVTTPRSLINPASKIHDGNVTEIPNLGTECWVAYDLSLAYSPFEVKAVDQFGEETLDLVGPLALAVPSRILYYERIS